jgi:hypothetical protein
MVPTASANLSRAHLALVPLQKAQIGSAVKSLGLARDSGAVSNSAAAAQTLDGTSPGEIGWLGRITGYQLDYGDAYNGAVGVNEVTTNVEQYKTSADAKRGLAFWRREDSLLGSLNQGGFAVTSKRSKVPTVGKSRFAYLTSYSASNIVPVSTFDERFGDGQYVLQVDVAAGTGAVAKGLATRLAKKLDARFRRAAAGTLHARAAKLPPKGKPGPPAGGPDLSTLALQTSDFSGQATLAGERYYANQSALSDYSAGFIPAGPFTLLAQEILWYPTPNQASFYADWVMANVLSGKGSTPVDLSGVGDGAQGVILNDSQGGIGVVVLSIGNLAETIVAFSNSAIQASDAQNMAQSAANYINNAGLGG